MIMNIEKPKRSEALQDPQNDQKNKKKKKKKKNNPNAMDQEN